MPSKRGLNRTVLYQRTVYNNHVHRALLENTNQVIIRMRKEKDRKENAQKRLTLLNK